MFVSLQLESWHSFKKRRETKTKQQHDRTTTYTQNFNISLNLIIIMFLTRPQFYFLSFLIHALVLVVQGSHGWIMCEMKYMPNIAGRHLLELTLNKCLICESLFFSLSLVCKTHIRNDKMCTYLPGYKI